jgi:hypothetical protein
MSRTRFDLRVILSAAALTALLGTACSSEGTGPDHGDSFCDLNPSDPSCNGGGGGGGGGGSGSQVVKVVGTWDGVEVGGVSLSPNGVLINWTNFATLEQVVTETSISMLADDTWDFRVYGRAPNQSGGGVLGDVELYKDYGTYTVRGQENGLTVVDFVSRGYPGKSFTGYSNGQVLAFDYDMTSSDGGVVRYGFEIH